jgi:hypothetical protein
MIPVLSHVNPLYTPPTSLLKVHFDPILPSMPSFANGLLEAISENIVDGKNRK